MHKVAIALDQRVVDVGGGCRGVDLFPLTDPCGTAVATGSIGLLGLAGLTLGGGYGPLIGQFGLACDSLISAEVVLADGSIVTAGAGGDDELLWALCGGGGNFGVVTSMKLALHDVGSVYSGFILYPFQQSQPIHKNVAADALDIQIEFIPGPDGNTLLAVVPTWSGAREDGEQQVAPLPGTPIMTDVRDRLYGDSCSLFRGCIVNGRRTFMTTRWLPSLDRDAAAVLIDQMARRPSTLCSVVTHNVRGAAARVGADATAFSVRQPHTMIEILAQVEAGGGDGSKERAWTIETAAVCIYPHTGCAGIALPNARTSLRRM
jgi:hypothetical protein